MQKIHQIEITNKCLKENHSIVGFQNCTYVTMPCLKIYDGTLKSTVYICLI